MGRVVLLAVVSWFAAVLAGSDTFGQQVVDPDFDPKVVTPAYTSHYPRVLIDEAHFNFHTMGGRYKPFADLIARDGCRVAPGRSKFTRDTLGNVDVLIVANALGAERMNAEGAEKPAFTEAECNAVLGWVRDGGSLLLITDHDPFGSAAESMAARFGVEMSKGTTSDPKNSGNGRPSCLIFGRDNKLLGDHPITQGRDKAERIDRVMTFTGQSLQGPVDAIPLLKLAESAVDRVPPDNKPVSAAGRAQGLAMTVGKGRVVVMGEAGLLSSQLIGPAREPMGMNYPGYDNRQLALNIMHWLEPPAEPTRRVTLEGLVTSDPLPEGYSVSRQQVEEKGVVTGEILLVAKEGALAKVVVSIDRGSKVATRAGKVAATKGYINVTAKAFVEAGMKITGKNIPDVEKADFADRLICDLTFENPDRNQIFVQVQVFFEKVGYQVQVVGDNRADFDKLLTWAKSIQGAP